MLVEIGTGLRLILASLLLAATTALVHAQTSAAAPQSQAAKPAKAAASQKNATRAKGNQTSARSAQQPRARQAPRPHASRAKRLSAPATHPAFSHYVEFRARPGVGGYGHSYIVHGELDNSGAMRSRNYAGLYPATETLIVVGHALPVPANTAGHPDDRDDRRVTASFRINMNRDDYARVEQIVREAQSSNALWHITLNNCNHFLGNVAGQMGLATPSSPLILPKDYVESLRSLNAGRTNGSPGAGAAAASF